MIGLPVVPVLASMLFAPPPAQELDLLGLRTAAPGALLPPLWRVRAVGGFEAPRSEIAERGNERCLRLQGTRRAAWFYRELGEPIPPVRGALQWRWRAPTAPSGADLRDPRADDAAIRVFVAFGTLARGRMIFYTWGADEADGFAQRSHVSDRFHVVRLRGARDRGQEALELEEARNPFADYRAAFGAEPPALRVVGVMQDTDQTGGTALAELCALRWVPDPAGPPAQW